MGSLFDRVEVPAALCTDQVYILCCRLKTHSGPTHATLCTRHSYRAATSSQVFDLIRFHFTSPPT